MKIVKAFINSNIHKIKRKTNKKYILFKKINSFNFKDQNTT